MALLLVVLVLAVLAGAAYAGYKYLGSTQVEPVPFHSTPDKNALPTQPQVVETQAVEK